MSRVLDRFRKPLERRLKLRLAGTDIAALVQRRDRARLRWLALESDDALLRFRALRSLAEILDPDAASLFFELAEADAGTVPPILVRTVAEGLGRLLHGDASTALRRLLSDNRPASVQLAAARALATIGREKDWEAVREWAVRADTEQPLFCDERDCTVPTVRTPPGTTPMVWVLETLYADKEARWWSSKAAGWLASGDSRPRMASDKGADKIVAQAHRTALDRKELPVEEFRRVALHLALLARDRDHEFLVDLLRGQDDAEHRRAVVQAVGLQADLRAVPLVEAWVAEVPDDQPGLAADLARVAGRLGAPELASTLVTLRARFAEPDLRSNVAWALGEVGGQEAVRALVDLVRARDEVLSDSDFVLVARSLKRCGVLGREAIRGAVAIARAGGGERDRVARLADLAGIH